MLARLGRLCNSLLSNRDRPIAAVRQTYSATFGGAPAGILGLRGSDPDYSTDTVEYDGIAHIHGLVMALATNASAPFAKKFITKGSLAERNGS
jgi:hypothetical protein